MKLVSVIVTNYNGKKYLDACLNSLLKQTYPNIEIIFSDDASSDGSVDFVRDHFPQIKLVANDRNSGLSITSNNGVQVTQGEYLFFLNNDTIAFPDLVTNLVAAIERDTNAAVAYPVPLPYDSSQDVEWNKSRKQAFAACGVDIYGYPCRALHKEKIFYPDAGIFIKREVFDQVGGFDPDFFLYGEDIDICWRIHLLRYKIVYVEEARFRHDSTCIQMENNKVVTNLRRRYLVERQVINMMLKYYRAKTLMLLFPKFLVLFTGEALFFLLVKLNHNMFSRVYLRALWWNIKNWSKTRKKRSIIQKIRKVDDLDIMKRMYYGYAKLETVRRLGIPVIR